MADNVYECMFIFNANAYNRNPTGAAKGIEDIVEAAGGEMMASRLFDERKLAYPINGHRKGVYWLTYVKLDGEKVAKMNRATQLHDIVLRHLFVKIDPRLVDAMVAVAQGKVPEEAVEEVSADASAEKGSEKEKEKETETPAKAN